MISKKLFPIIILIYFFQYVSERNLNYSAYQNSLVKNLNIQSKFAMKVSLLLKCFLWLIHLFVLEQNGKWKALKYPVIEMPVSKNSDWLSRVRIEKKNQFWKICSAQLKLNHSTSRTDEMLYFSMPIKKNAKYAAVVIKKVVLNWMIWKIYSNSFNSLHSTCTSALQNNVVISQ